MKATKLFTEFFQSEKAGGFILIFCTAVSLVWANTSFRDMYAHFWHTPFLAKPVEFWINDGLMTVFFLLVGLEIEREIYVGEFADYKKALLPILAAAGGMLVPAAIHFAFNHGTAFQHGFGIPMATDIAFSLSILSLLGSRVPLWIKVFLTALAIIDDLGAILIIALFYSSGVTWMYMLVALFAISIMIGLNRLKVHQIWIYLLLGAGLWYCLYQSGVHPTITGVLLAFMIPFGDGGEQSPSYRLQHFLHKPVAFIILPVFALANTAIQISPDSLNMLMHANSVGILLGLMVGKPLGILLFSLAGVAVGLCVIPEGVKKSYILGAGMLAGIGFTMSIFISLLAFEDPEVINASKLTVLIASLLSGAMGYFVLRKSLPLKG